MTQHRALPVIHDGDHGSDDFIATLLFAACPDQFDLLGVTVGFGNTTVANAARNAGLALAMAGRTDIPLMTGAVQPFAMPLKKGDNAFSADGLGGVEFPGLEPVPPREGAVAWMARTIAAATAPVTLCLTGLMTNTALLLRDHPEARANIAGIVAMGGCIGPLGPQGRCGNITPFAEFNFQQDPAAADFVLNSGLPIVLLPMDATHQTVLTPARQDMLRDRLPGGATDRLIAMMRAAEHLDIPKFGTTGSVLHDENVPLYLLRPELYGGRRIRAVIETDADSDRYGQLIAMDEPLGEVTMIHTIRDPDAVFATMLDGLDSLEFLSGRKIAMQKSPAGPGGAFKP